MDYLINLVFEKDYPVLFYIYSGIKVRKKDGIILRKDCIYCLANNISELLSNVENI